jgi:hypothetical protein
MLWSLLSRALAVIAVAGLLLVPIVPSTVAMAAAEPMASTAMAIGDDMSCFPQEKPVVPICQKNCPPMASCAAGWLQGAPVAQAFVHPLVVVANTLNPQNDDLLARLSDAPPLRPPRT